MGSQVARLTESGLPNVPTSLICSEVSLHVHPRAVVPASFNSFLIFQRWLTRPTFLPPARIRPFSMGVGLGASAPLDLSRRTCRRAETRQSTSLAIVLVDEALHNCADWGEVDGDFMQLEGGDDKTLIRPLPRDLASLSSP